LTGTTYTQSLSHSQITPFVHKKENPNKRKRNLIIIREDKHNKFYKKIKSKINMKGCDEIIVVVEVKSNYCVGLLFWIFDWDFL
jgi:hypothetical protein